MAKSRVEKNKSLYEELELESFELEDITSEPKKVEVKKEETKVENVKKQEIVPVKEEKKNISFNHDISNEDFKSYLNLKKGVTKPRRIELPEGFADKTTPYFPRRRINYSNKPKNIAEEIEGLSPELKAFIFSGAFDRKNFDK